jgi:phosphonate degradation associated HDIG domain protein
MPTDLTLDPISTILQKFRSRGHSNYGGEAISQLEHALQAATLAEQTGATSALIAACLLHDVGHLLHDLPEDAPDDGTDDEHEQLGAAWLDEHFQPAVVEPVRLHVAAKRYLCAVDQVYDSQLSGPSRQSLALQGGPMTPAQAKHFEAHPHFLAAIDLRRWDEAAKVPQLATPPLEHFVPYLQASLL